ncbi:MAG: hypothetical protein ACTSRS_15175 [Candidatus Helarchaeota archaeon]
MGRRIRMILWISGTIILLITFLTMLSQVFIEKRGWEGIDQNLYLLMYIFGGSLIGSMFVYDFISYLLLRSEVIKLMDATTQITPEQVSRQLGVPLWRVLPIFRRRIEPGILISLSGNYIHFNKTFQEAFLKKYATGLSISELANQFSLSKKVIQLILDELDFKDMLPSVEVPKKKTPEEISTKGLRKTVRHKRKIKKKR